MSKVLQWVDERDDYNKVLAKYANPSMKRFFGLDSSTYDAGALDKKTKELLGLVASFVLRCDDCILYHLIQAHKAGVNSEELAESLMIGMLVGGSITIPHLRRAMKIWDEELGGTNNPVTNQVTMEGVKG